MSDQAPSGLPPVPKKDGRPKVPDHLPVAETAPAPLENVIPHARRCTQCGTLGRVISSNLGVSVRCPKCKYQWPISTTPLNPSVPLMPDRGFHKHTLVEPDWNNAYTDSSGGSANESFGPPVKK